jgi:hypothetical protein
VPAPHGVQLTAPAPE